MKLLTTGFRDFAEPEGPPGSTGRQSRVAAAQPLLVLADASLRASEILSRLGELARGRALEVVLIRVLPPGGETSGTATPHARGGRDGGSHLAPVIAALSRAGACAWSISCWGQPAAKIAETARALGADLVVVRRVPGAQGTRRR